MNREEATKVLGGHPELKPEHREAILEMAGYLTDNRYADSATQIEKLAARYERNMHKPWKKPMTNADRIRAMSDDELAEFVFHCMHTNSKALNKGQVTEWLKQPVKEDA